MLEIFFPYYIYTYMIEALKRQPICYEKKANVLEVLFFMRKNTVLLSPKEGTGKGDCQKG